MTIGHASELEPGSSLDADVCIVGAGAAGLTMASWLDGSSMRVVIVEAGPATPEPDLESSRWDVQHVGVPWRNPEPSRGFGFGGSTKLWFGRVAMPDAIDLQVRPWVRHSGWPIDRAELVRWSRVAAEILSVPSFDRFDISSWPSNGTIATFNGGGGGGEDTGTGVGVFLWSTDADMGAARRRRALRRSANVRVLLDATARELVPDEGGGRIDGLQVRRADGSELTVRARRYVLAAGGLENPRLMLASTAASDAGVGNAHDLVGRYYLDHPRGEGHAVVDLATTDAGQLDRLRFLGERTPTPDGKAQLCVTFSEELQRREELLNHAMHAHLVTPLHLSDAFGSAKRLLRRNGRAEGSDLTRDAASALRGAPALLYHFARSRGRLAPSQLVFIDQMEQEPDPDSRVTIDRRRIDAWGLPQLRLDWRIDESTFRSQRRLHELVRATLERVGVLGMHSRVLDSDERPDVWDMKHPSGTTRMADSPSRGVVDANCCVHGVDNLYVAGSSVFPTVGHFNPTLVIVALAARLADHLERCRDRAP